MEARRQTLEKEVADLRREKEELESRLRDHILSPQCHFHLEQHEPVPYLDHSASIMADLETSMHPASEESLFDTWNYKPDVDALCSDFPPFSPHHGVEADCLLSGDETSFDLESGNWKSV